MNCRILLSLKVGGQVGYLKDPSVFLLPAFLFCCSFASGIKTKEHSESFLDPGICFTMTLPSHYFYHSLFLGYREVGWHGKARSSDIISGRQLLQEWSLKSKKRRDLLQTFQFAATYPITPLLRLVTNNKNTNGNMNYKSQIGSFSSSYT